MNQPFHLLNPYLQLIEDQPFTLSEKIETYYALTERHLQAIWFEQKYFKNLTTSSGQRIEIISPGIWNAEAGPDFLKAHIKIDDKELKGDIEIHLNDCSWEHHKHHIDSRYNNVILHLSLWPPHEEIALFTANQKMLVRAYLHEKLTISFQRILQLIDLDLYPYKSFLGSGRCAHEVFKNLKETKIIELLKHAAYYRLEHKYAKLFAFSPDIPEQIGIGIAHALGYKHNSDAFFTLYDWFKSQQHLTEEQLLAGAMSGAGFFSEHHLSIWQSSSFYNELNFLKKQLRFIPQVNLSLSQIRPLNHPIRRMAALIQLIKQDILPTLHNQLINYWEDYSQTSQPKVKVLYLQLLDILPDLVHPYWNHHYTFEAEARKDLLPLIGTNLKKEVLLNLWLPLLYQYLIKKNSEHDWLLFQAFYSSIPACSNSKSNYLTHRFFGETPKGKLLNRADREQGASQLHRDFCVHYEASCEGCPFPERYKRHN